MNCQFEKHEKRFNEQEAKPDEYKNIMRVKLCVWQNTSDQKLSRCATYFFSFYTLIFFFFLKLLLTCVKRSLDG